MTLKRTPRLIPYEGNVRRVNASVQHIVFSQDSTIAIVSGSTFMPLIFEPITGRQKKQLTRHESLVPFAIFDRDGKYAYSCSTDSTIKKWDVATGQELICFRGHRLDVTKMALSPEEDIGISISSNDESIRVWDLQAGKQLHVLARNANTLHSICMLDSEHVLTAAYPDREVKIWNYRSGALDGELAGHDSGLTGLCVSNDGKVAVSISEDGTVINWNPTARKAYSSLRPATCAGHGIVFTSDNKKAFADFDDSVIYGWSTESGEAICSLRGHGSPIIPLALFSTDDFLLSGSLDGTVRLWDLNEKECVQKIIAKRREPVNACSISPDGKVVMAGDDHGRLYFFSVEYSE